jgi:hypothetical protein
MNPRATALNKHFSAYKAALLEDWPEVITFYELDKAVPETAPSPEVLDGLCQKALAQLLKAKLDADPSLNLRFKATTNVLLWNQLLTAARVKELAKARIVKKGGKKQLRYDVGDLAKTFFGKAILEDAGLKRQKVLDKEELERLTASCAKVNLSLPETVEPTATEVFFSEDGE